MTNLVQNKTVVPGTHRLSNFSELTIEQFFGWDTIHLKFARDGRSYMMDKDAMRELIGILQEITSAMEANDD